MVQILIVDDQPYLCELFPHELMGENCSITCASNAESVKRYLSDSTPDMVLIEISLNGFEGWDVLNVVGDAEETSVSMINRRLAMLGWDKEILDELTLALIMCLIEERDEHRVEHHLKSRRPFRRDGVEPIQESLSHE